MIRSLQLLFIFDCVVYFFCFSDFGKNAEIDHFSNNTITIRRLDGSLVALSVSPYPSLLHNYVTANRWDDALRLARFVKVGSCSFFTFR